MVWMPQQALREGLLSRKSPQFLDGRHSMGRCMGNGKSNGLIRNRQ